jgi:hypothetical protein
MAQGWSEKRNIPIVEAPKGRRDERAVFQARDARPHRLAVDRDMLRAASLLQTQRAQHIGQSLCVDDPQCFRQRRMTRRLSTDKAQPCFLPPGQAASKNKSRSPAGGTAATE